MPASVAPSLRNRTGIERSGRSGTRRPPSLALRASKRTRPRVGVGVANPEPSENDRPAGYSACTRPAARSTSLGGP